jgi:hypothetical protein
MLRLNICQILKRLCQEGDTPSKRRLADFLAACPFGASRRLQSVKGNGLLPLFVEPSTPIVTFTGRIKNCFNYQWFALAEVGRAPPNR